MARGAFMWNHTFRTVLYVDVGCPILSFESNREVVRDKMSWKFIPLSVHLTIIPEFRLQL